MTSDDVIRNFANQRVNRRHKAVQWTNGRNCYCEGNTLYSYGCHFPLATLLGERDGQPLFLKNGDRYSLTTNRHQRETQNAVPGPTVSKTALDAAGIRFDALEAEHVIDWTPDHITRDIVRRKADGKLFRDPGCADLDKFTTPRQGMFLPYANGNADPESLTVRGYWHTLGAVLIRWEGEDYLASLDEGRYFVSRLARPARTVHDAFHGLKPKAVRRAERDGVPGIVRQGEYFFIPFGQEADVQIKLGIPTKKALRARAQVAGLPRDRADSNIHEVRHMTAQGRTYATGRVFHRQSRSFGGHRPALTREHRTVNLGSAWFTVHRNTQTAAWSQGGNFD